MKRIITLIATVAACAMAFAQSAAAQLITWTHHIEKTENANIFKVVLTGAIAEGYHTYTLTDEFSATEITDVVTEVVS